jgi:hypothetical protein
MTKPPPQKREERKEKRELLEKEGADGFAPS